MSIFKTLFQKNPTMHKLEKLAGLIGREAASISAEELAAVNEELAAAGINGLVLAAATTAEVENPLQATVNELTASLATATEQLTASQEEITALGGQVAHLTAELEKYKPDADAAAAAAAAAAVGEKGKDKETDATLYMTAEDEAFMAEVRQSLK